MIRGNIFSNLFDAHPPFRMDGNFGYASGICEILAQSHMGEMHLLPALADAWPDGSVKGMRARGGFEVDMRWEAGKLAGGAIRSSEGRACTLRTSLPVTVCHLGNIAYWLNRPLKWDPVKEDFIGDPEAGRRPLPVGLPHT